MAPGGLSLRGGGPCGLVLPVDAIGRASVKRAMRPDLIVEGHGLRHPLVDLADGLVGVEGDFFVFEAPPQPLDEDIVPPAPSPISQYACLTPTLLDPIAGS